MDDLIIILVLIVILGLASVYIYKAKKSGKKCIGCPYADSCTSKKCAIKNTKDNRAE